MYNTLIRYVHVWRIDNGQLMVKKGTHPQHSAVSVREKGIKRISFYTADSRERLHWC